MILKPRLTLQHLLPVSCLPLKRVINISAELFCVAFSILNFATAASNAAGAATTAVAAVATVETIATLQQKLRCQAKLWFCYLFLKTLKISHLYILFSAKNFLIFNSTFFTYF